ncbi:hypothetical protein BASA81_004243 [Batrachochytrium salamandrivorans]|nr:hypothetical protein BASA81_004243 [Batrachochytrium salamandrivorans]
MKLSSFFVAAMVITSANAVWLGEPEEEDISPQITEQSVTSSLEPSPDPDSMSNAVQKQMDDYSVISYMFNGDEEHDDLLKNMLKIQEKLFSAVDQSKTESRKNIGPTELNENPTQAEVDDALNSDKTDYQYIVKLLDKTYGCLNEFKSLMSRYLKKYLALPENSVILSFGYLQKTFELLREDLKLSSWM